MTDVADLKLMFVGTKEFEKGAAIRGGMLVTDSQTKPLEFRCSNPIRPTALQKILYGDVLDTHVLVSLIGVPLIQSSTEGANMVIVRDRRLLKMQEKTDIPLLWVARNEEDTDEARDDDDVSPLITCETGKFEPIVVRGAPGKLEDAKRAREFLTPVFAAHGLLEPFERIDAALERVHLEQAGEKR